VVACQHPTWGAEMATKAGASATAVSIIRRHQERLVAPPVNREENMLHLLQLLDNQN
jgi:predicted hydrolase (HD superfamily)